MQFTKYITLTHTPGDQLLMPDVRQAGQVIGDGHPAPGLVSVHSSVETTQTSEQRVTL